MTELKELLQTKVICESEYPNILFHGTPEKFSQIDIDKSRTNTDFGKGFYLTSIFEQAVEWAGKRRKANFRLKMLQEIPLTYVLKFELSLEKLENLKIKVYEGYSEEWLDKIYECRTGGRKKTEENDVTVGPMADNDIYVILEKYESGIIGKADTLKQLKFQKPNMQIAFHTDKSLEAIKFIDQTFAFY